MDNYDGNPSLGGEPAMDTGDWRCQLQADSREIIVNKISGTLKRHLPLSGQEGLVELKKIAVRFEEKIYAAATSQSDYLRKISLKMLTMETKSQNTVTSSLQSNSAGSSVMQPQVTNQGQLLSENIQSNIPHSGIQFSAGLSSAQAPTPALNMSALLSALPPSPGTDASISSALPSPQGINMSSSSSELFPAYGLIQSESSSALSPAWSLNVLANYPLASSHQSPVQSASLAEQSFRLQQNQQSAIPHLTESMLQQTAMPQQHQAQQLIATLDSTAQIGDENGAEWQEEVYQKVRCQTCKVYQKIKVMKEMYLTKLTEIYQKNAIKLEQLESLPQQPKLYRLEKLKIHKTMLEHLITVLQVSRSNISPVLKGKLGLYEKQIISFINTNKPKKPDSSLQQGQLTVPSMGHSHSHATQVQSPENQMNPQLQSMNLQSSVPTMQQNNITGLQQNSMSSLSGDSTAQTGHTNGADWQEEVYQKIKVMKEMYYPELSEMYQKIASKLHQHDSLPQQPKSEQLEKLKMFKAMLERLITVLQISKSNVSPGMKEKLNVYEKQIINFINTNRPRKPVSTLQPGQLPPPHMQSMQQSQSQINQVQSHENQMNPQLQSMNLQGSVPTMQQNNMTGLQQNSMSSLSGVSTAQQNMMNPLQPSSNMDPGQGTSLNSLQQNGINMLQNNINPLQSNPGILHSQHLKQQEHQLYHNQLKQQYQQRQMQQQLMQKQQIIQQQLQLQQQAKQQLPGQLQAHQMPQLHQISDVDDVKNRPGSVKPGTFLSGDGLRQNSVSSLSGVSTQQNMMNPLQSSSNADPGQGVSHQLNAGFLHNRFLQQQQQLRLMFLQSQQRQLQEQLMQKNQIFQQGQQQEIQHLLRKLEPELPQVNVVNDMNTSALLSSQSESNMLQGSIDSLNSSSRMGDNKQHQKQEQEEKVFQNQLKQPYQQLQMQQQWTQKPQMLQEKQQQQIQQLQQQTKQQLHHIYFIYLIFLAILLGAYLFGTGY